MGNAELEAKLEDEKKRSYSLDLRYRALEFSRRKTENDREMLELTCTETVTRLDAMASQEEWWNNACGVMSPLILTLSNIGTMSKMEDDERTFVTYDDNDDDQTMITS